MNKVLLTLTSLGLVASACAQQSPTAMKYGKIITPELAKQHLSIIASDAFEGRETGKPGADKAAHYIADEFKALGLQPIVNGSYFFDVAVVQNNFKVNTFTVNGAALENGKDFFAFNGNGTKNIGVKDVVFIGYGIGADNYDDLKGIDIAGKVVMYISNGEPMNNGKSVITGTEKLSDWSTMRARKRVQYILSKKPALLLAVNAPASSRPGGAAAGGRAVAGRPQRELPMSLKKDPMIITINIPTTTADTILKSTGKTIADLKAAIDQTGKPASQEVKADVNVNYATEEIPVKAVDVLGFLPGSDPKLKDEVLVISAHYDHIGLVRDPNATDKVNNGADDDGSGTTGILEIARAFSKAKKDGHGPKRSILFLGNVGEEKGLLGSEYYTDHPVIPLSKTIADLNIDMIGRVGNEYTGKADSANYVYLIGSSMLSTDLHNVSEKANQTYTHLDLDYKYDDLNDPNDFYHRSDHYNFARFGVPIIFYFNGVHADYHRPGDEVSKINFPLLAKRAQLVFYTAWDLLNAPNRPVVDKK